MAAWRSPVNLSLTYCPHFKNLVTDFMILPLEPI